MCARERQPLPQRIANAPELFIGLEFFYVAFLDLSSCRAIMEGPISWLAIDDYAIRRGLEEEQREDLLFHIPKMDRVFLDFHSEKRKKELKSNSPPIAKTKGKTKQR
jgi:hypothetical protein